ncbi:DUF4434 domain-containing protein [Leifsonia sp. RAF41]|uniref:DUF4434 domain-containing protein n=1 Tax=Leifsonia sp. RAF41 TaxID=3233056 RepID=UPI003F960548
MRRVTSVMAATVLAAALVVIPATGAQATNAATRPDCSKAPVEHVSAEFVRPDAADAPETDPAHPVSWWGDPGNALSHGTEWSDLLTQLKALCMDQVVLQWSAQTWAGTSAYFGLAPDDQPRCVQSDGVVPAGEPGAGGRWVRPLYESRNTQWDASRVNAPDESGRCVTSPSVRSDQVKQLLEAAKTHGMRVWLGLQIDEGTFFGAGAVSAGWMAQQTQLSKDLFDDLWAQFGAKYGEQIAGIYLPFEGNNVQYSTDPASPDFHLFDLLNQYTDAVSTYVTGTVPGLGIMVSPYHTADVGADPGSPTQRAARDTYASVVSELLRGSSVSVYAPQDGAGAQNETVADLAPWMIAARTGINIAGTGTKLWGNAESYTLQANLPMPIQAMVTHLRQMNGEFWGQRADLDGYAGFSANNLNTASWWWDYRSNRAYTAAYATYLRFGFNMAQTVPAVGADRYPGNSGVSAALIQGSYDVTVQWPRLVASTPTDDWKSGIVIPIVGYQVFRDGQPIGQVRQPLSDTAVDQYGFARPLPADADHPGVLAFTDPNVQSGRTYTYQVSAFDAYGNPGKKTSGTTLVVPLSAADTVDGAGTTTGTGSIGQRVSAGAGYATVKAGTDPLQLWNLLGGDGDWKDGSPRPKLADGITGEATYADPAWAGLNVSAGARKQVTVNLAEPTAVHQVRSNWLVQNSLGISQPAVTVETASADASGDIDWQAFTSWATDPGTGTNVSGQAVGTAPAADPGTGWLDATLNAGEIRSVSAVRLTVTGTPGFDWAFLSEVTLIGADGKPISPCGSPRATTMIDTNCVNITDDTDRNVYSDTYIPTRAGKLTSPSAATVGSADDTPTNPWASASSVGWSTDAGSPVRTAGGLDVVVDLGQNQPIGTLATDWYTANRASGITSPAAVEFSYHPDTPDAAPDLTTGWSPAPAATTIVAGGLTSYRSVLPKLTTASDAVATTARWIKAHIALPTSPGGWLIAASITAYTPAADDLTNNRPTAAYPTRDTTNPSYDLTKPTTGSNNTTIVDPAARSLSLPSDNLGNALPSRCAPPDVDCVTHSTYGNTALTATDGGKPVPNKWTEPWAPDANVLVLQQHSGWDITVPVGSTYSSQEDGHSTSRLDAVTLTFTQQAGQSALPTSLDVFYHSEWGNPADPYGIADDATAHWQWSGHTARKPVTPPYIPKSVTLITTYTIPPFSTPTGAPIAKLRFHMNAPTSSTLITGRLHTTVWQ